MLEQFETLKTEKTNLIYNSFGIWSYTKQQQLKIYEVNTFLKEFLKADENFLISLIETCSNENCSQWGQLSRVTATPFLKTLLVSFECYF